MPASTYAGNALLNLLLRGIALPAPAAVYVSLHTADPGLDGSNEVTTVQWPSYQRQHASRGGAVAGGFQAAAEKSSVNAMLMTFGDHDGANPIIVTHFAIWDAQNGGNCFFIGELDDHKTYLPSDEAVIRPTSLTLLVV